MVFDAIMKIMEKSAGIILRAQTPNAGIEQVFGQRWPSVKWQQ